MPCGRYAVQVGCDKDARQVANRCREWLRLVVGVELHVVGCRVESLRRISSDEAQSLRSMGFSFRGARGESQLSIKRKCCEYRTTVRGTAVHGTEYLRAPLVSVH